MDNFCKFNKKNILTETIEVQEEFKLKYLVFFNHSSCSINKLTVRENFQKSLKKN